MVGAAAIPRARICRASLSQLTRALQRLDIQRPAIGGLSTLMIDS